MPASTRVSVARQLRNIPAAVRPTVQATRRAVKSAAPSAKEIAYRSQPPRSKSAMWKLVRYVVDEAPVVAIGTFPTYASLFFYRGREIDDHTGLLEGAGKQFRFIRLRTRHDAERPAVRRLLRQAFALGGARR